MSGSPLAAATVSTAVASFSSLSLPPPAILGFLFTAGTFAGARERRWRCCWSLRLGRCVCSLTDSAEQSRQLLGDGLLYLLQQAAAAPAAVVGELLEAGNGVHAKEVLVGLLVRQVKLADVGLGQNGLEDVVLVWLIDDVLEDLVGVAEPAQLVVVCLEVAVHQQRVDADTNAMLANESNLVLHLVLNHLRKRETQADRINKHKPNQRTTRNIKSSD